MVDKSWDEHGMQVSAAHAGSLHRRIDDLRDALQPRLDSIDRRLNHHVMLGAGLFGVLLSGAIAVIVALLAR